MEKVSIYCSNPEIYISTEMNLIPRKGDFIGVWVNDKWTVLEVEMIVFEFSECDSFDEIEIRLKANR